jgi:hypothetical protein
VTAAANDRRRGERSRQHSGEIDRAEQADGEIGETSMRAVSGVTIPTRLLPPISNSTDNSSAAMEEKAAVTRRIGVGLWFWRWSHTIGRPATPFRAEGVR